MGNHHGVKVAQINPKPPRVLNKPTRVVSRIKQNALPPVLNEGRIAPILVQIRSRSERVYQYRFPIVTEITRQDFVMFSD